MIVVNPKITVRPNINCDTTSNHIVPRDMSYYVPENLKKNNEQCFASFENPQIYIILKKFAKRLQELSETMSTLSPS